MRHPLANRVEHHQLLAALSIEAPRTLPTVVKCPICREDQQLEVLLGHRQGTIYRCRNRKTCGFHGDGIELFAVATRRTVEQSCIDLLEEGVLPGSASIRKDIDSYVSNSRGLSDGWIGFWHACQRRFINADSATRSLLQASGAWESGETTLDRAWLGFCMGAATGADLINAVDSLTINRKGLTYFKSGLVERATYLVMPLWGDHTTITGLAVWGRDLTWQTLNFDQVRDERREVGTGLLPNHWANDPLLLVVDDPLTALQLTHSGLESGTRMPVVFAPPGATSVGWPIVQRVVMVLRTGGLDHYRMALGLPECHVVSPQDLLKRRGPRSAHAIVEELQQLSRPAHAAVAELLTRADNARAASTAQYLQLSSVDAIRILTAVPEHRREFVQNLLNQRSVNSTVNFGGDVITCDAGGWLSEKKGRISNTQFYIERVLHDPQTGSSSASGVIITDDGKKYDFSSPLKDVLNHTATWLSSQLLGHCASLPQIQPGWGKKLAAVSQLFRAPSTSHVGGLYGWTEDRRRLVLPRIVIADGVISGNPVPSVTDAAGSGLSEPQPLKDFELKALLIDDQAGGLFWALFCGVVANLYAPLHQQGTHGLALVAPTGGALEYLVRGLVSEVGIPSSGFNIATVSKMEDLKRRELHSPLPVYVSRTWKDHEGFGRWLRLAHERNCLVEMDRRTAIATSFDGGWVYVNSDLASTDDCRRFQGLWRALALFVAWMQSSHSEWPTLKTQLIPGFATLAQRWLSSIGGDHSKVFGRAETLARLDVVDRVSPPSWKILGFIVENAEQGLLKLQRAEEPAADPAVGLVLDRRGEVAFISRQQFCALFDAAGLVPPTNTQVVDSLSQQEFLVGTTYRDVKGYAISLDQYNLQWALRKTVHA